MAEKVVVLMSELEKVGREWWGHLKFFVVAMLLLGVVIGGPIALLEWLFPGMPQRVLMWFMLGAVVWFFGYHLIAMLWALIAPGLRWLKGWWS
jgi:hypothetical protein